MFKRDVNCVMGGMMYTQDGLPVVRKETIDCYLKSENFVWPLPEGRQLDFVSFLGENVINPAENIIAESARSHDGPFHDTYLDAAILGFYDIYKLLWLDDMFNFTLSVSKNVVEYFNRNYFGLNESSQCGKGKEHCERLFVENAELFTFCAKRVEIIETRGNIHETLVYAGSTGIAYELARLEARRRK